MTTSHLSVFARPRPRTDSLALAAAWNRPGAAYALDTGAWAKKQVEKIRSAWYSGAYFWPPMADNFTEETQDIRDSYLPMLAEPLVKAGHLTKAASVQALDCSVIPADPDDERQRQAAAAFKWVLDQIGQGNKGGRSCGPALIADEVLRPAMIAGWSLSELVGPEICRWKGPAFGKEYWRDLKGKDTRRLALRLDGYKNVVGVRSFTQAGLVWEGADLQSFVVFAHWPLYCSPSGMSDFRAVYRAVWIKNVAMRLRGLGLDRWTHPYLKGAAATQEQKDALRDALEAARGNGFIVTGPDDMVEAVSLAVGSDDVFHSAIQDLDREILVGVAWSHLPIQEGQTTGGRGDTSVQQGTAELGQWALAAALGGVVTGQMCRPWYERNFADVEPARVVWGAVNEQALMAAAQLDKLLLENGLKLSRHERQQFFGRAAPEDDDDTLAAPQKPPPGGGPGGGPGGPGGPGGNDQGPLAGLFSERHDDFAEGKGDDVPDIAETAPLIAELIYHLYGDRAAEMLQASPDFAEDWEAFAAGWSSADHPRGKGGRFIPRGSPEAVSAAQDVVRKVLKGDPSAQPEDVVNHLAILTVKQLRQLHQQAGVKSIPSSILRQHLVDAVTDRLTSSKELKGLRDEFQKVKGARPPDTMTPSALRKQIELAKEKPAARQPPVEREKPAPPPPTAGAPSVRLTPEVTPVGAALAQQAALPRPGEAAAPAVDPAAVHADIAALNRPEPRTSLPPLLPALYDRLKAKHPGLTEPQFHAMLRDLQARDLGALQRDNGEAAAASGYPAHRFPAMGGIHGQQPAAWFRFRPGAAEQLAGGSAPTAGGRGPGVLPWKLDDVRTGVLRGRSGDREYEIRPLDPQRRSWGLYVDGQDTGSRAAFPQPLQSEAESGRHEKAAAPAPAPAPTAAPPPVAPPAGLHAADPGRLGDAVARANLYTSRLAGRPYVDNSALFGEIKRAAPGASHEDIRALLHHLEGAGAVSFHSVNEKHKLTPAERETYAMHRDPNEPTSGKEVFLMDDPAKAKAAVADWLAQRSRSRPPENPPSR